ncbi:MAG: HlyC/CorC family transporter, partial [Oscillospiraceae bacterium]|nr:HlyC/CorC family transporter [Oscillospiraceae bacterium]
EEEGVLDEDSVELLQSAIEFDEREVQEILTHRVDMTAVDINDPIEEIIQIALNSEYSRIPVYDDSIDKMVGILQVNHLIRCLLDTDTPDIHSVMTDVVFVPQTKKLPEMLEQMRREKFHIAVVTDDYGGALGIVTMEDILEEIVGEIWDETDVIEPDIIEQHDGSLIITGDLMLGDLLDHLEIEDEELDDYIITVSGWVTEIMEDYPEVGENFLYNGWRITVTEVDGLRVAKLSVVKEQSDDEEDDD